MYAKLLAVSNAPCHRSLGKYLEDLHSVPPLESSKRFRFYDGFPID